MVLQISLRSRSVYADETAHKSVGRLATTTHVAAQLNAECGLTATQQISNLCYVPLGAYKIENLTPLDLAKMFIIQLEISTCKSISLEC